MTKKNTIRTYRSEAKQIIVGSLFVEFWMNFRNDGWRQKSDENCDVTSVLTSFLASHFQHSIFFLLGFFLSSSSLLFFFVALQFSLDIVLCCFMATNMFHVVVSLCLKMNLWMNAMMKCPRLNSLESVLYIRWPYIPKTENGAHLSWIFIFATSFSLCLGHQVIHANHAHEQNDSFAVYYLLRSCIFFSTSGCVITETRFIHSFISAKQTCEMFRIFKFFRWNIISFRIWLCYCSWCEMFELFFSIVLGWFFLSLYLPFSFIFFCK